jgi:hypothetical protein
MSYVPGRQGSRTTRRYARSPLSDRDSPLVKGQDALDLKESLEQSDGIWPVAHHFECVGDSYRERVGGDDRCLGLLCWRASSAI